MKLRAHQSAVLEEFSSAAADAAKAAAANDRVLATFAKARRYGVPTSELASRWVLAHGMADNEENRTRELQMLLKRLQRAKLTLRSRYRRTVKTTTTIPATESALATAPRAPTPPHQPRGLKE